MPWSEVLDLLKSYGPNLAGWVLLFLFVLLILGHGGVTVMRHYRTILTEGEAFRVRYKEALTECERGCKERDRALQDMARKWTASREVAHQLRNEMSSLVLEVHRLQEELHRANKDLENERATRLQHRVGDKP